MWNLWWPTAALALLAGCQTLPRAPSMAPRELSAAVHWFRNSAEMRAAYEQTYRIALRQLQAQSRDLPVGSWGVILDVDETVLDNSPYEMERDLTGIPYSDATWDTWTGQKAARALPGAIQFAEAVHRQLGGKVVLVTNRSARACPETEQNLRLAGIPYDRILCRVGTSDKNPRFEQVQAGSNGFAPTNVLMWIGDNIQDFPALSQGNPDLSAFGVRYFVLPNPMYGSWDSKPAN
jgi:5'-nucleotidase (lipoprotein e(P4) family)